MQVSTDSVAPSALRTKLVRIALSYLGTPYCIGGTSSRCMDCSGFVSQVYLQAGMSIARSSKEIAESAHRHIPTLNTALPGDLLLFDADNRGIVTHVGLYLGDSRMIHASTSRGVVIDDVSKGISGLHFLFVASFINNE